jgi:predicted nucleotidyltransferase
MQAASRSDILTLLSDCKDDLAARFGVRQLSLFGSAARDELREGSDVDLLVEFAGPVTFDAYFGLKDHLQALFGRPVDLVTPRGLKPRARSHVEQDLIRVA